jgi:hypothetical protein
MANKSNLPAASITTAQRKLCERYAATFVAAPADSKLGLALTTKGRMPINGLRHPVADDTNGWYIWCGEDISREADFFASLHASHVYEEYPEIAKFLGLPPGYRFLFAPDSEDVWFDESLLNV